MFVLFLPGHSIPRMLITAKRKQEMFHLPRGRQTAEVVASLCVWRQPEQILEELDLLPGCLAFEPHLQFCFSSTLICFLVVTAFKQEIRKYRKYSPILAVVPTCLPLNVSTCYNRVHVALTMVDITSASGCQLAR